MHQFVFSISSWFCLGRLYIEESVHFFSCSSISLAFVIYYDPLHFCGVSCNFSFSISDFMDLGLIFFSLMSLARDLSILFIFSKNQILVSLIFSIVFFVSISFICALIFIISFLLLTLSIACSSSSSCFTFKVKLLT